MNKPVISRSAETLPPADENIVLRIQALDLFASLIKILKQGNEAALGAVAVDSISANTSHLADISGAEGVAGMFAPLSQAQDFELQTSNVYIAGSSEEARVSSYLSASIGTAKFAFGAVMLVDLVRNNDQADWKVAQIKLQLTWLEGHPPEKWAVPAHDRIWQRGDSLPVIVSEVDAPWHLFPQNSLRAGEEQDLIDTYPRYSWGIDQADFGLLTSAYTEDAAGTFRPLGPLSGRASIIGVLKDFRRGWPWMQHYGEVIGHIIDEDRAAIIVGRRIPQAQEYAGKFGAYYPMRLRRSENVWRIMWTEYRPGWFEIAEIDIPALLTATLSGEGDWPE